MDACSAARSATPSAPIEFLDIASIRNRFGAEGLGGFAPAYGRPGGAITDDTQMTLFTAEGLIRALVRGAHKGICHPPSVVRYAYGRWLVTQGHRWPWPDVVDGRDSGWLVAVPGLHEQRAPGNTCLSALDAGADGTPDAPINDSKGCGGVMRVAPVGLAVGVNDPTDAFTTAAECAALTHGHPSGWIAAGAFAHLVAELFHGADLDDALHSTIRRTAATDGAREVLDALAAARALADRGRPSAEEIETLGGGWVAEEALAIAVCCALVAEDLHDAVLLAVNHSGDSDSTGSLVGNLLGVRDGEAALPADLLEDLELRDVITTIADDLTEAFHGEGVGSEYEPESARSRWARDRYPGG